MKFHVRLGWLVNANSAGQIVAAARGFYREEGLDVTFREGGLVDPSVKTVAAGTDDMGFANGPDLVIAARAAGAPLKIVAVIHQDGYHGFFVREDSGILTPRDWIGRRVGIKLGSTTFLYYQVLLSKFRIDRATIHEVPVAYDLRPFLVGDLDVYPGATNNEALTLEDQGLRLRHFMLSDYGIPTIGNVLFTNEKTVRERGDLVRRFISATMRGWAWCRISEHQDTVLDYLLAYNAKLERSKEKRALAMTLPLVGSGAIDREKLAAIIDTQIRYGDLRRRVGVDEVTASLATY